MIVLDKNLFEQIVSFYLMAKTTVIESYVSDFSNLFEVKTKSVFVVYVEKSLKIGRRLKPKTHLMKTGQKLNLIYVFQLLMKSKTNIYF